MSDIYRSYAEAAMSQDPTHASHVEPLNDNLILLLLTSGYVVDLALHQFISDITGGAIVARSDPLAGVAITGGILNFTGPTFPSVAAGQTITQVVMAKNTGDDTTSPLVLWVNSASGLPDTTNGSDVDVDPDPGTFHAFGF